MTLEETAEMWFEAGCLSADASVTFDDDDQFQVSLVADALRSFQLSAWLDELSERRNNDEKGNER
jgi:hypothetical protein